MENKSKRWFRRNSDEMAENDEDMEKAGVAMENSDYKDAEERNMNVESTNGSLLGQKDALDSLELDLVVASEALMKRRRLELTRIQDLQHQLQHLQSNIAHNANILDSVEKKTSEYESMIRDMEKKLTDTQMRYNQLMEDFDTYQVNMKDDTEKLRFLLSEQSQKYNQLLEEYSVSKNDTLKMETRFQEELRTLKAENHELKTRYDEAQKEKKRLLETFNEFTSRLTSPFTENLATAEEIPSKEELIVAPQEEE